MVSPGLSPTKLWIYTNYDCNLRCSYCVAESTPQAPRRAIGLENVRRLVDEAVPLGFEHIYFTGGEPLLLTEINSMLAYASARLDTTLLTNAMLARGRRLEQLCAVRNERLTIQVSLDGCTPEQHDAYRGAGSWARTLEGLRNLQQCGFKLSLSTTETPANTAHLAEICAFHLELGIPESAHLIRPLARRGFSQQGMEVSKSKLAPELTANDAGIYWHPLSTDPDLQVFAGLFPLADAVHCLQLELDSQSGGAGAERQTFK